MENSVLFDHTGLERRNARADVPIAAGLAVGKVRLIIRALANGKFRMDRALLLEVAAMCIRDRFQANAAVAVPVQVVFSLFWIKFQRASKPLARLDGVRHGGIGKRAIQQLSLIHI